MSMFHVLDVYVFGTYPDVQDRHFLSPRIPTNEYGKGR